MGLSNEQRKAISTTVAEAERALVNADAFSGISVTRLCRALVALWGEYKHRNNFVPKDPECVMHDMEKGPCKCGAWH